MLQPSKSLYLGTITATAPSLLPLVLLPALCGFLFVQVERFPYQKVVIMNVPSSELLEYGMQIIYDTIRERKSQLDEQKQKRKVRLQGDAIALMSEFKQSLLLPDGIPSGSS